MVVDGLSALAIEQNAAPFLSVLQRRIAAENWSVAPLCIVSQGRVAIGDEVGELLGAKAVVVLIGERPGPEFARQHGPVPDLDAARRPAG